MVDTRDWDLIQPFKISRQTITRVTTVEVELTDDDGHIGRGSAVGLDYAGETPASIVEQIESVRDSIERGVGRIDLLNKIKAGGARCAIDSALWDLEAKRDGIDPFTRAGVNALPVASAITLPLQPLDDLAAAAARCKSQWIKVKTTAIDPIAVVRRVREAAPRARLIVDPNQSWSFAQLERFAPALAELRVDLLEQPMPAGSEDALDGYRCPVRLCADESCDGIADLAQLAGRVEAVNIKLDKAGGLTAALAMADEAEALGLELMVGCMLAPSRAIAPAMVLAQRCSYVDLDAPPFLIQDNEHGFCFENGLVTHSHRRLLWG